MNFYQDIGYLFFGSRLKRLSEAFLSDVNNIYKKQKIGFDASWFPVFYILAKNKEVSIRHISNELVISHSAASQMISNLQEKGFIKSVVSKKDARHKAVTFTVKGEKLLKKVEPVWQALQEAMNELASESNESKKLPEALTALENNLKHTSIFERVEKKLQ